MSIVDTNQTFPNSELPETIAIMGVGLIGGSIAAALKDREFPGTILGVGRNATRLSDAQAAGLLDEISTDVPAAAKQSDMMIVLHARAADCANSAGSGCCV